MFWKRYFVFCSGTLSLLFTFGEKKLSKPQRKRKVLNEVLGSGKTKKGKKFKLVDNLSVSFEFELHIFLFISILFLFLIYLLFTFLMTKKIPTMDLRVLRVLSLFGDYSEPVSTSRYLSSQVAHYLLQKDLD